MLPLVKSAFFLGSLLVAVMANAATSLQPSNSAVLVGAGASDLRQDVQPALRLEYRSGAVWKVVQPMAGVLINTDNAAYLYAGIYRDFALNPYWYVTPNFSAGIYRDGDSHDLGGPLEFQSGIEVSRKLASNARIGVSLRHLSNASIYDDNPGTETLMVFYTIPLGNR